MKKDKIIFCSSNILKVSHYHATLCVYLSCTFFLKYIFYFTARRPKRLSCWRRCRPGLQHHSPAMPSQRRTFRGSRLSGHRFVHTVLPTSRPPNQMVASNGNRRRSAILRRGLFPVRRSTRGAGRLLVAGRDCNAHTGPEAVLPRGAG